MPYRRPSKPDTSSLIILEDFPSSSRPKSIRRLNGIGGDMQEMMSNLDVSLSVGMFDRAALLIRRVATKLPSNSDAIRELHNKYLQMMAAYMFRNSRPGMIFAAQRWFEVDLRTSGVDPDATTYALMLKMSLSMLHGSRRRRTVDRYWRMVTADELEEAVLTVPVLSDADLGLLAEVRHSRRKRYICRSLLTCLCLPSLVVFKSPSDRRFRVC
jgi:DNA-directed RNA polymerase